MSTRRWFLSLLPAGLAAPFLLATALAAPAKQLTASQPRYRKCAALWLPAKRTGEVGFVIAGEPTKSGPSFTMCYSIPATIAGRGDGGLLDVLKLVHSTMAKEQCHEFIWDAAQSWWLSKNLAKVYSFRDRPIFWTGRNVKAMGIDEGDCAAIIARKMAVFGAKNPL